MAAERAARAIERKVHQGRLTDHVTQVLDNARHLRLFIDPHGDLSVNRIAGAHVRAFRDTSAGCPRNAPKHLDKGATAELTAWAKANPSKPKLAAKRSIIGSWVPSAVRVVRRRQAEADKRLVGSEQTCIVAHRHGRESDAMRNFSAKPIP